MGGGVSTLVLNVVGWVDASAVLAFSDVDLFVAARNFDVKLGIGVALVAWLTITTAAKRVSKLCRLKGLAEIIKRLERPPVFVEQRHEVLLQIDE